MQFNFRNATVLAKERAKYFIKMQNSTIFPQPRTGERTVLTGRWKTDDSICITRSHRWIT